MAKSEKPVEEKPVSTEPVVVAPPAAEEAAKPATKAEAASDWPKFLRSATGFGYCDPVTKIRYGANPVRVDAAPKEGSWLDCQMKAKYIVPA